MKIHTNRCHLLYCPTLQGYDILQIFNQLFFSFSSPFRILLSLHSSFHQATIIISEWPRARHPNLEFSSFSLFLVSCSKLLIKTWDQNARSQEICVLLQACYLSISVLPYNNRILLQISFIKCIRLCISKLL